MIDKNIVEIFQKRLKNKCNHEDRVVMESTLACHNFFEESIIEKLKFFSKGTNIQYKVRISASKLYKEFSEIQ